MKKQPPKLHKIKILDKSIEDIDELIYERCLRLRQISPEPKIIEKAFDEGFEAYLGYILEKSIPDDFPDFDEKAAVKRLKSAKARVRKNLGKTWKSEVPKCDIQIDPVSSDLMPYGGAYNKALDKITIDTYVFQKPEIFGWLDYVIAHEICHNIICLVREESGMENALKYYGEVYKHGKQRRFYEKFEERVNWYQESLARFSMEEYCLKHDASIALSVLAEQITVPDEDAEKQLETAWLAINGLFDGNLDILCLFDCLLYEDGGIYCEMNPANPTYLKRAKALGKYYGIDFHDTDPVLY